MAISPVEFLDVLNQSAFSSLRNIFGTFTEILAAVCLNLGMETYVIGATHDLPVSKVQWIFWRLSTSLEVTGLTISPFTSRKMVQTAVRKFSKLFKCIASWYAEVIDPLKAIQLSIPLKSYALKYLFIPFKLILHSSWIIDLPSNKYAPEIPRGSYNDLRTLSRSHLANGFLGNCHWNPNVSSSICQIIPRLYWSLLPVAARLGA